MNRKKPTIKDIAREAGVSISTVSRVINNNYPVHVTTRKKVEKVIKKKSFRPNYFARGLIQNKTNSIGVLVPSLVNVFFPVVVTSIENYLKTKEYTLFLCDTEGTEDMEREYIQRLTERKVDGIICLDPRTGNIRSGFYEEMTQEIPLVLVNAFHEGIKCNFVLNDQESGSVEALDYLHQLHHEKIAFLRGGKSYSYDLKEEYYLRFLKKKSIPVEQNNILSISSGNDLETVELSTQIVYDRLMQPNPPTAILACNDWMGVGAINAVKKLGLQVPRDVSVIGFDDTIIAELSEPKLSSVSQNMKQLGKNAAQLLLEIIDNPSLPLQQLNLPTFLVHRNSCAPPQTACISS